MEIDDADYERLSRIADRSDLLDESAGIGLWQAILVDGDAMHPESEWTWSPEFRRMIGFETEDEFPDKVQSWADRLHPDDVDATFAAFAGHLEDKTGAARYDIIYRLKIRDGSYRWFRATGGCRHLPSGQIRACGSLADVHDAEVLRLKVDEEARTDAAAVEVLADALAALAQGDLSVRLDDVLPEKMSRLRDDFNTALTALSSTMATALDTANTSEQHATEVRTSVEQLTMRSASQASSIEETSAAVVQIASTVKHTAELATDSARSAQGSREKSDACREVVARTVDAMGAIEKSSDEIGSIIGTIENIAFQTNMLALNAAVEAARAGDAGRGFAVVASEVRSLAQRSTDAAREISDLINAARGHVSKGVGLVKNTGDAITEISQDVTLISESMSSVSQAASEQSAALEEIEIAIAELDQLTQKNSTMAQNNEVIAARLSDSVSRLGTVISQFTLSDPHGGGSHHYSAA